MGIWWGHCLSWERTRAQALVLRPSPHSWRAQPGCELRAWQRLLLRLAPLLVSMACCWCGVAGAHAPPPSQPAPVPPSGLLVMKHG
jgi:hypothetical protein